MGFFIGLLIFIIGISLFGLIFNVLVFAVRLGVAVLFVYLLIYLYKKYIAKDPNF